jgi:hypothetical protein
MQHPIPELYIAQKQADLQREIEHNGLVNEAKKANLSPHERKPQTNPFQGHLIKRLIQVVVSFLTTF